MIEMTKDDEKTFERHQAKNEGRQSGVFYTLRCYYTV